MRVSTHLHASLSTNFASLTENVPAIREIQIPQNNSQPLAISSDANGSIWFAETNPAAIVNYDPLAKSFGRFPVPTSNESGLIWFLIIDGTEIWFSCSNEPLLWSFSTRTLKFSNYSTGNPSILPYSLALDSATSQIWFTSIYTDQIGAFQINSGGLASLVKLVNLTQPVLEAKTLGPKYGPSGVDIGSNGNVFVTETLTSSIVEYNQTSERFEHFWNLKPGSQPVGIAVNDSSDLIWFTNHASSQIGSVDEKSGVLQSYATSLFSYNYSTSGSTYVDTLPYWIQLSSHGMVWFDEHVGNKIARLNPSSGELTEFIVPTPQSSPLRFDLDEQTGLVWFTEFQGNKLGIMDENQSSGLRVNISPKDAKLASQPTNITVNSPGMINLSALSVSGTLARDGNITGNLTLSFVSLNSSAYEISLSKTPGLGTGNYSLTICLADQMKIARACGIVLLNVLPDIPGEGSQPVEIVLALIVLGVGVVAFFRRTRGKFGFNKKESISSS